MTKLGFGESGLFSGRSSPITGSNLLNALSGLKKNYHNQVKIKLLNEFEVKKKSISAKKFIKKYTIYNHFNKLSSILKIV